MKQQFEYFFAALRFFTRLPVPAWVGHGQEQLNHAARWFPLVGVIVGAIGAAATELAALVLPIGSAVLLGMVATVLVTGGFHEDGFADSCDGFGGGWDKAQVLAIMKDSRIGSYGVLALGLALLTKFNALLEIDAAYEPPGLACALVAGHAVSRMAALWPLLGLDYVRPDDPAARSAAVAARPGGPALALPLLCGLAPCLLLSGVETLIALGAVAATAFAATAYFRRRLGGYSGDCLGATQQLCELAFYLGLLCSST